LTVARVPLAEASALLQALFPEVPEGQRIQVWTLPDKASYWFASAEEAAAAALRMAKTHDVYVSGGLRRAGLGVDVRGKSDDVTGLAALWADFDVAGVAHAKKGLPQSMADVERILSDLPLQPSAIVASGTGGVHAWWIFHEVWDLTPAGENAKAQALAYGWGETIRQAAKRLGFAFDSLADLARVLRVPGTFNHKGGTAKPVRLEEVSARRFDPSEFEPFLTARADRNEAVVRLGNLVLSGDANPAIEKFEMLASIDPKFRATWEGRRPDLPSGSEYDLSVATLAIQAGWSDQEVVDLMIARRRKAGQDLKLREDYYARTLTRAHSSYSARTNSANTENVDPENPESRTAALAAIKHYTGLDVVRILATGARAPEYSVILADGRRAELGVMKDAQKWETWWSVAFEMRCAQGKKPKDGEWRPAITKIQTLVEEIETEQASLVTGIVDLLQSFLGKVPDASKWPADSLVNVVRKRQPYRMADTIFFALQPFQTHVGQMVREKYTRSKLINLLLEAGCKREEVFHDVPSGARIHRTYWAVPVAVIDGRSPALHGITGLHNEITGLKTKVSPFE
jgi:hypothetical protein